MTKPIFIDLGGNTARVDPQKTPTAYVRLQLITQQDYDDATGEVVSLPQVMEVYLSVDQADALADALKDGRMLE